MFGLAYRSISAPIFPPEEIFWRLYLAADINSTGPSVVTAVRRSAQGGCYPGRVVLARAAILERCLSQAANALRFSAMYSCRS